MNEKDITEIKNIITDLDKRITRDDAFVQFVMYGGGPDESCIQANQKGYLRLGIEFLKAAFAPYTKNNTVDVDIGYLTSEEAEMKFDWLERRDDIQLPKPYKHGGLKDMIALVVTAIVLLTIITFVIIGIIATFF